VFVFLANGCLIYSLLIGVATKLSLSALGLLFMSRPVLSCILAYPIGWWGSIDNQRFALFFLGVQRNVGVVAAISFRGYSFVLARVDIAYSGKTSSQERV
jgi:hypothetical protein